MNFYSSFQEMRIAQNIRDGEPNAFVYGITNAYSEAEKQKRVAWCDQQIEIAEREIEYLQGEFTKAHNQYRLPQYMSGRYAEDKDRRKELEIRVQALRNRLVQIRDTDTTGQFVTPCFAIEEKLNDFTAQLGQTVDKPAQQKIRNELTLHRLFQE